MRKGDLNKKCAVIFDRKQHQLLAEALAVFRASEPEITEDEAACLNQIVHILSWQIQTVEAEKRDEAIKRFKKNLTARGQISTAQSVALVAI